MEIYRGVASFLVIQGNVSYLRFLKSEGWTANILALTKYQRCELAFKLKPLIIKEKVDFLKNLPDITTKLAKEHEKKGGKGEKVSSKEDTFRVVKKLAEIATVGQSTMERL